MHAVYLIIGGNINNRLTYLQDACADIEKEIGTIKNKSSIYESEPWGFDDNTSFLNQVILVTTSFSPQQVLEKILAIERQLGRIRTDNSNYQARTIDIDILFYDDVIIETETLIIPHPKIAMRKFVLIPLNEIATNFMHPIYVQTINNLLKKCEDNSWVKQLN